MIAQDREAFTERIVGQWKPCTRIDDYDVPNNVNNTLFPAKACDMLEITMDFPSCWDGRIDSSNHGDRIKYPDEDDDDSCEPPHDKRIPTLSISIYKKIIPVGSTYGATYPKNFTPIILADGMLI